MDKEEIKKMEIKVPKKHKKSKHLNKLNIFLLLVQKISVGYVPSVQQKSSGLKFRTSRTGSYVTYSCHHNASRFTFPIFVHLWCFSVFQEEEL